MCVAMMACAPTLRVTRLTPPDVSLGPTRAVGVEVHTEAGKRLENAVFSGLVLGAVNVPVDVEKSLSERVTARLPEVGATVCQPVPCGDATVRLTVTESSLGPQVVKTEVRAVARVTVRVNVTRADGALLYTDRIWDNESDTVVLAHLLIPRATDGIAAILMRAFTPKQVWVEIPLEDDGPCGQGVELLLSGDPNGAQSSFEELTAKEPGLACAHYGLGVAAEVREDFARAAAAYRQAAARDNKHRYLEAASSAERNVQRSAAAAAAQPVPQLVP